MDKKTEKSGNKSEKSMNKTEFAQEYNFDTDKKSKCSKSSKSSNNKCN